MSLLDKVVAAVTPPESEQARAQARAKARAAAISGEGNWFLDIRRKLSSADQDKLTQRYKEQFARYMGEIDKGDNAARLEALRVKPTNQSSRGADGNA